jgi:hypothetical protein
MSKQLVNLIGGVVALAIVLLGLVVCALPLYTAATTISAEAERVATQNDTDQARLDALTAQAADTTQLDADVAELRAEMPAVPRLDDVLQLALDAAARNGGTVTSVAKGETAAFAVRQAPASAADGAAPAAEPAADASGTDASGTEGGGAEAGASGNAASGDAASAPADAAAAGPQQVQTTVTIDLPDVAAATRALDALRAGPRLVAVVQAGVTSRSEEGVTLTATLLVFSRP